MCRCPFAVVRIQVQSSHFLEGPDRSIKRFRLWPRELSPDLLPSSSFQPPLFDWLSLKFGSLRDVLRTVRLNYPARLISLIRSNEALGSVRLGNCSTRIRHFEDALVSSAAAVLPFRKRQMPLVGEICGSANPSK